MRQTKKSMSGNSLRRRRFMLGLLASLFMSLILSRVAYADEALILVVGAKPDHPYGSHMYEFECRLLATCIQKNSGAKAEYVPAWPPSTQQQAAASSIVFYSSPAGSVLLTGRHRNDFAKLMERGVGLVAIHWGTGVGYDKASESAQARSQFKGWLGGWFRRPPCGIKTTRTDLRIVNQTHPIGRGWTPWKIHDEFYLDPVLHHESQPLLEVTIDDKSHVVGWALERRDGGRSVGITLGHFHHNFARDGFRRMLVNSILWSAHVTVPKNGAIVSVEPKEIQLPTPAEAD